MRFKQTKTPEGAFPLLQAQFCQLWLGGVATTNNYTKLRQIMSQTTNSLQLPSGYHELLQDLKGRIRAAQMQAAFAVNRELILLYWSIGRDLSQRFALKNGAARLSTGSLGICRLSLRDSKGFSPRNLRYMRSLAEAWPDEEILQQLVAKLPWSHNVRVLDRIKDRPTREVVPSRRPRIRLGARMSWSCRSRAVCMRGKGRRSPTSRVRCLPLTRTWRSRSSRTPTTLIF
jgi:hypothetical protein